MRSGTSTPLSPSPVLLLRTLTLLAEALVPRQLVQVDYTSRPEPRCDCFNEVLSNSSTVLCPRCPNIKYSGRSESPKFNFCSAGRCLRDTVSDTGSWLFYTIREYQSSWVCHETTHPPDLRSPSGTTTVAEPSAFMVTS